MNCDRCPFRGRPQVGSEGDPETCKYVIVGEAPAYDEVKKGRPFIGQTGRGLMKFFAKVGIQREECFITNALRCQIPKGKTGLSRAIDACRGRLIEELESVNADAHIAILGRAARDALFPDQADKGILASRGWHTWKGRDVFVSAHPSFVILYNPDEAPLLIKDLERMKRGRQRIIKPFEVTPYSYGQMPLPFQNVAFVISNIDELEAFVTYVSKGYTPLGRYTAFDLETDQVDYQRDRILCMSISTKPGLAFIVTDQVLYEDGNRFVTTNWSKDTWERFLEDPRYLTGSYLKPNKHAVHLLSRLFSMNTIWTGHNMKFDLRFLAGQLGVAVPKDERRLADTILMHYAMDERGAGHGLKAVADDYYDVGDYEGELFDYIAKKSGRYSQIPRSVLYMYNATDTECTLRLAYDMEKELRDKGLFEHPFRHPLMHAVPMLLDAELRGLQIDWSEADRIEKEMLVPTQLELRDRLREISGHPDLNPLSSQRIIAIMFDELRFPKIEVRTRAAGHKIKGRTTQKAMMDGWAKMHEQGTLHVSPQAWEFCETLREYRHIRKLQGSYIKKWRRYMGTDMRVHPSYLLRGTVTGRLSAKDPPVQTIPSKVQEEHSIAVANIHVPTPGYKFLYADYSQAELMALAVMSEDEFMLRTFREGMDYHSEVARTAYGDDFTRDERQACKRLTFGWAYGGNVAGIAMEALQFEGAVAQRFAHEWDELFKGAVAWRKHQGELMVEQGYVESVFGRRRRYPYLTRQNVGKAKRVAINSPIQSAVSDLTLCSAVRLWQIYENDPEVHVVLLIHDSLIMEVKEERVEEVSRVMHDVMVAIPREHFPQLEFKADVKVGSRLGELT